MFGLMIVVFVLGYIAIALEHPLKVNKAATALVLGVAMWTLYVWGADSILSNQGAAGFQKYLSSHVADEGVSLAEHYVNYISHNQLIEVLGELSSTIFFLLAAMTIVEIIDKYGGFRLITEKIRFRQRVKLLWTISLITFFLSAILDNLTTAIVMVALLRKIIGDKQDRWFFAGMVIIAANSGGAWSPIGDVTTIMLWVKGNLTTMNVIQTLILPSMVSLLIPLLILSYRMKGEVAPPLSSARQEASELPAVSEPERRFLFFFALFSLVMVPIFKTVTHLPPFLGMLFGLGMVWLLTELLYRKYNLKESYRLRVTKIVKDVDISTILFFLGILLAVGALQSSGMLGIVSTYLDEKIHNIYIINLVIGVLSAIVDNVPLVAGAIGMHPAISPEALGTMPDAAYMSAYMVDGKFWELLAYSAGTGGSMLIIGSAAGVAVMGIEKIDFMWYLKNISIYALAGYIGGFLTYWLMYGLS
jgi:Na+/H+ antiporter NhaD/arsenite permease-like protein